MNMSVKEISELGAEEYLASSDMDARIADLSRTEREDCADGESWEAAQDELASLEEFRSEVSGQAGADRWNRGMTLVAGRIWDEFAEDEAEDLYGRAAVQSGYFDSTAFAEDLQTEYQQAELDGQVFWYRVC